MSQENITDWRVQLEMKYTLICKVCSRKVLDPDKKNVSQIFTKARCGSCNTNKDQIKQKQSGKKLKVIC